MPDSIHDVARSLVTSGKTQENLASYFASFTGRLFEPMMSYEEPDRFHASDMLAVQALSVLVPVETAYDLMHGVLAEESSALLAQIPTDVEIGRPSAADHLSGGSPADRLWRLLTRQAGIGWVIAGKLMACKRPLLVPVYDQVVRCVLGAPVNPWLTLDSIFAEARFRDDLRVVRSAYEVPDHVTDLRLFDVIAWMSHAEDHSLCVGRTS